VSKYLQIFSVAFGVLMILGGMWYFDIYANIVNRAARGDIGSFFICRDYPENPNAFPTDGYPPCWVDFFSGHRLNITVPAIVFQAIGAALVVLGLTWNRLSDKRQSENKIKKG
jgi:hypothetical protein